MRKAYVVAVLYLVLDRAPALAGRTSFGGLTTTDVVPDGSVELESRVSDENDKGSLHDRSTSLWLAPAIGLSDCVELHLPVEMTWRSETGSRSDFTLSRFGADVRYRFARSRIAPLFRFALERDVTVRNLGHIEIDLAVSYEVGVFQFLVDAGLTFEANRGGVHFEARPGAGVSVRVKPDVRLGAEVFGVRTFDTAAESWAVVGPNLAWTHGRFWFAAAFGIGIHNISSAARLVWGVGF